MSSSTNNYTVTALACFGVIKVSELMYSLGTYIWNQRVIPCTDGEYYDTRGCLFKKINPSHKVKISKIKSTGDEILMLGKKLIEKKKEFEKKILESKEKSSENSKTDLNFEIQKICHDRTTPDTIASLLANINLNQENNKMHAEIQNYSKLYSDFQNFIRMRPEYANITIYIDKNGSKKVEKAKLDFWCKAMKHYNICDYFNLESVENIMSDNKEKPITISLEVEAGIMWSQIKAELSQIVNAK